MNTKTASTKSRRTKARPEQSGSTLRNPQFTLAPVGREEAYRNAVIARVLQTFGPRARVVAITHEPRPVYEFPAPDFVSE
jgi:hypothetical protein